MSYDEFEEISKQNEIELFGLCGLSGMYVNEIESMHWSRISNERKYSISNNTSLFGDDVVCWNLNKFTRAESNLHSTRPHYELNVSMSRSSIRKYIDLYIFNLFLTESYRWNTIT